MLQLQPDRSQPLSFLLNVDILGIVLKWLASVIPELVAPECSLHFKVFTFLVHEVHKQILGVFIIHVSWALEPWHVNKQQHVPGSEISYIRALTIFYLHEYLPATWFGFPFLLVLDFYMRVRFYGGVLLQVKIKAVEMLRHSLNWCVFIWALCLQSLWDQLVQTGFRAIWLASSHTRHGLSRDYTCWRCSVNYKTSE